MDAVIDGRLNKSRYELLYTVKTVAVHIVHSVVGCTMMCDT